MQNLVVRIVRFVDEHQPGFVACEFIDAEGRSHTLMDKVPIFTIEALTAASSYPCGGIARCEILKRWKDPSGRELVRISTARPDGIESTEGLSEFVVFSWQLSSAD